jgi:hypothetical protein
MNEYLGTADNDRIEQLALRLPDWVNILGLAGDDTIIFSLAAVEGGPGNDVLVGSSIYSSVNYDHSPSGIEADLEAGWVKDGWGTTDSLNSIRVVGGSPFPDTMLGSRLHDTIWADAGDYIDGRAGNDVLVFWRPSVECSWYLTNNGELTVRHHSSGQTIRAVNIEELRFQDKNVLLPPASSTSRTVFVDRLGDSSQAVTSMVRPLDINNDGLFDIVLANGTFPPDPPKAFAPRLLLQLADGSFKEATVSGPRTELIHPRDFASGDFNGDGFNDVVIVGHGYDTSPFPGERSVLLLSDRFSGWVDRSDWLPVTPAFTHSVSVADVNHDGIDDIFLGNIWGQQVESPRLLLGGSNGLRSSELPQLAGNLALQTNGALPVGSLLCDLNGDSFIDLVAGGGAAGTMVFWGKSGDGDGRWFQESATGLPTGRFGPGGQTITVNIVPLDVTNDGRIDLLLSQTRGEPFYGDRAIQLLAQNSDGTFIDATAQRFPNFEEKGQWIVFLTTVDLNGDGFIDVLGSTQESGVSQGAMAWLNDGNGVFWEQDGRSKFPSTGFGMPVFNNKDSLLAATASSTGALTVTRFDFPDGMANKVIGTKEIDSISFSGLRSAFQIDSLESNWRVWQKQSNGTMPVVLDDVERLKFSDNLVALDTDGVAGQGYRIYKAAFDRTPDGSGLGYWIAQMDKGMNVTEVAARFIDSPEFRSLYGQNPSNAEFLTKVYTNVLGRKPDQGGYSWWLNELNTNPDKSRQKVLADFSESQENKDSVAALIGNGIQYVEFTG